MSENRERVQRENAAIMAKRRHLEDFIARNKARAATAGLAQSKAKALEKLETVEVLETDEPTAQHPRAARRAAQGHRAPLPRRRRSATRTGRSRPNIQLELDHGSRAAVVGDNGQGKTTFLRTHLSTRSSRSPAR